MQPSVTVTVKCHLLKVRGACRPAGSPLSRAQGGALGRWVVTSAVTCHPQGEVSLGPVLCLIVWLFRDKCHPFIQPKFMISGEGYGGPGDPQPWGRGFHAGMSLLCHVIMLCEGAEGGSSSCVVDGGCGAHGLLPARQASPPSFAPAHWRTPHPVAACGVHGPRCMAQVRGPGEGSEPPPLSA